MRHLDWFPLVEFLKKVGWSVDVHMAPHTPRVAWAIQAGHRLTLKVRGLERNGPPSAYGHTLWKLVKK